MATDDLIRRFECNCVISNVLWLFYLHFVSDKRRNETKKSKKLRVQTIFRRLFYILYLFSPFRQTHLSDCPGKIIKQSSSKFFFANVSSA